MSSAIARAKEVMEGKHVPSTVENRWFRLQAKRKQASSRMAALWDEMQQEGEMQLEG